MKVLGSISALFAAVFLYVSITNAAPYSFTCPIYTTCVGQTVFCPEECPDPSAAWDGSNYTHYCQVNCGALGGSCNPFCKPIPTFTSCNSPGSVCFDPRFVGADGGVFYFHGRRNEHFNLVSDHNLQINSRFIGHRPAGRPRDFTWIQALGILFNSHSFSLEATKAATWDENIDHLRFAYDGEEIDVREGGLSTWTAPEQSLMVKRTANRNRAFVTIPGVVDVVINVVPVTKEDDRIHNYKVPSDDCFVHLEVQFSFSNLSSKVDGVLGHTYQPDFVNPAKPGVAVPVLGGDAKYRTTSLLAADCQTCIYSPGKVREEPILSMLQYSILDCTGEISRGNGIVCRK